VIGVADEINFSRGQEMENDEWGKIELLQITEGISQIK
jgi:hypothetical protein